MALQEGFFARHAHQFPLPSSPPLPSLPLLYTELHLAYQALLEPFIVSHLTSTLPSFTLASLPPLVAHYQRSEQVDSSGLSPYNEVLDVLVGLSDFEAFFKLMQDRREEEEETKERERKGKGKRSSLEGFGLQVISLNGIKAGKLSGNGRGR